MAFTKITTSELNSRGATTLPNQPKISATALKQEFDAPAKEVVAPKFNNLIDELEGESAAASVGATAPTGRTGNTVQAVMNKLSVDLKTVEDGMSEAIADAHTHANKDLLDTYTQTEEDIAQAIADDHTHANKALLDTYEQTESDLSDAVANTHSHSNKSVLDKFGESSGQPTYDGNPIGGGEGDMLASDYDPDDTVKNSGGIVDYVDSQAYELPAATSNTLGGVMQGTNVSIDANGVISATDTTYTDATTSQSGLMSATDKTKLDGIEANANNYSLPTASTSQLGGVKVDGSSVTINSDGVISASGGGGGGTTVVANPTGAATDDLEKLQVGTTIYEIPDTTYESKQAAQGGTDVSLVTTGEKYTWNEKVSKSATAGLLKNDGTVDQTQYVSDVSGKTDKVSNATNGNFAGLDSNGNLTDSGKKASDFLSSSTVIPSDLTDLGDVDITSPTDGQVLQYDAASQKWVNGAGGGNVPPQGSTATPTDVIQTWLNCANIWDKSYTTINEVLADSTTLLALISSNNAADYMKRSTTWASAVTADSTAMSLIGANDYCADELLDDSTWRTAICNSTYFESVLNVKVPTMTGDTTPSGVGTCFASSVYNNDNNVGAWKAFDKDTSSRTYWNSAANDVVGAYVGFEFPNSIKVCKFFVYTPGNEAFQKPYCPKNIKLQGSNDGTTWSDVGSYLLTDTYSQQDEIVTNPTSYSKWRIYVVDNYGANAVAMSEVQFYGRA